ncbi:hypothetical protein Ga0609869_003318 [Rhodovulum iodosum]|uniref:Uncharacterized protein n=1 Tax=Rhodovulum iodosum TaxID=68291 RepID=A0ABV3XX60_9RHOB
MLSETRPSGRNSVFLAYGVGVRRTFLPQPEPDRLL